MLGSVSSIQDFLLALTDAVKSGDRNVEGVKKFGCCANIWGKPDEKKMKKVWQNGNEVSAFGNACLHIDKNLKSISG